MIKFNELEMKYGTHVAYQCLVEIEKAALISSSKMTAIDPETRLANAIMAQDAVGEASAISAAA